MLLVLFFVALSSAALSRRADGSTILKSPAGVEVSASELTVVIADGSLQHEFSLSTTGTHLKFDNEVVQSAEASADTSTTDMLSHSLKMDAASVQLEYFRVENRVNVSNDQILSTTNHSSLLSLGTNINLITPGDFNVVANSADFTSNGLFRISNVLNSPTVLHLYHQGTSDGFNDGSKIVLTEGTSLTGAGAAFRYNGGSNTAELLGLQTTETVVARWHRSGSSFDVLVNAAFSGSVSVTNNIVVLNTATNPTIVHIQHVGTSDGFDRGSELLLTEGTSSGGGIGYDGAGNYVHLFGLQSNVYTSVARWHRDGSNFIVTPLITATAGIAHRAGFFVVPTQSNVASYTSLGAYRQTTNWKVSGGSADPNAAMFCWTDGNWNVADNSYTFPTNGIYHCSAQVRIDSKTDGYMRVFLSKSTTGNHWDGCHAIGPAASSPYLTMSVSCPIRASAGEKIYLFASAEAGVDTTWSVQGESSWGCVRISV